MTYVTYAEPRGDDSLDWIYALVRGDDATDATDATSAAGGTAAGRGTAIVVAGSDVAVGDVAGGDVAGGDVAGGDVAEMVVDCADPTARLNEQVDVTYVTYVTCVTYVTYVTSDCTAERAGRP